MPNKPTDRFQVLERPVSHPGKCRCCGTADRRVTDFGADDEDGIIYLCEVCIIEAASKFGAVPAEVYERLLMESTSLIQQNEKAGEYANELLTDITFATNRFFDRVRGMADQESSESDSSDSKEPGDSNTSDAKNAERSASKNDKPSSKQGSSSVSAATGDGSIFKSSK